MFVCVRTGVKALLIREQCTGTGAQGTLTLIGYKLTSYYTQLNIFIH